MKYSLWLCFSLCYSTFLCIGPQGQIQGKDFLINIRDVGSSVHCRSAQFCSSAGRCKYLIIPHLRRGKNSLCGEAGFNLLGEAFKKRMSWCETTLDLQRASSFSADEVIPINLMNVLSEMSRSARV